MISFPNCKINLGLNITAKRADGFHDLETVFYPVGIKDVLEIVTQPKKTTDIEFTSTGLKIAGDTVSNLCIKAYHLLKKDLPQLPPIKMHLHKNIPMGAGLGGGSADGAFALKMLNGRFNLNLSTDQLINYALQLGSDCPFFIINQPCYAESRGEKLQPVELELKGFQFIIINPGIHVNTGWAFSQVQPAKPQKSVKSIISQAVETWKDELVNDFEAPVCKAHPEVKAIKEHLYAQGAVYAAMSGSGSTVYGIFEKGRNVSVAQYAAYKVFVI